MKDKTFKVDCFVLIDSKILNAIEYCIKLE